MSIEFPQDSSVQLTYSIFPFGISSNDNYTTSNYVNILSTNNSNYTSNVSNVLKSFIDTTNTNLTNNYYNKTSTDTLLNAKENSLTFSSPLTRTTNTIGINLGSYSTSGTDASYVLKTGSTMIGALLNTSSTASEFKGIYINHPASKVSHIPYLPDNKIYFRAPVVMDQANDTLSFGSRLENFLIYLYGADYGFG